MAICKGCGAKIIWIGKMPCDPAPVTYWAVEKGRGRIVKRDGTVVSCEFEGEPAKASGTGYVSHYATCPQGPAFRRKERKKAAKATEQTSLFDELG